MIPPARSWSGRDITLGLSMAGIIAALAPDVVVVGGGVVKPHGIYWSAFESTARASNTVTDMSRVTFVPAALGYEAGVIGAALWGRMVERGEAHRRRNKPDNIRSTGLPALQWLCNRSGFMTWLPVAPELKARAEPR